MKDEYMNKLDLYIVIKPFLGFLQYDKIAFKKGTLKKVVMYQDKPNIINKDDVKLSYISSLTVEEYEYLKLEEPTRIF